MDSENAHRNIFEYDALRKDLLELQDLLKKVEKDIVVAAFNVVKSMYDIDIYEGATLGYTSEFEAHITQFHCLTNVDDLVFEVLQVDPKDGSATIKWGTTTETIPLYIVVGMREVYLRTFGGHTR